MKDLLAIIIALIIACFLLIGCVPEKEIQVQTHTWILISKRPGDNQVRDEENNFREYHGCWLTWKMPNNDTRFEWVPDGDKYPLGSLWVNKDRR